MRKEILIQVFLIILVLTILIFIYQKYFKEELSDNIDIKKNEITKAENNLINIEYESIDREGRRYIITAETGNFKEEESELIFMTNVNAKIFLLDGSVIYVSSLNAEYNTLIYDTRFYKEVKMNFLEHNIVCENLNIFFNKNLIEAFNNLNYKNLDIIMLADKIEIDLLTKNSKIYNFNDNNIIIKNRNLDGNN
tara:strand:+ start:460 stop:1041 length:582 start_codon:yes stop_codon:yes gene_type:complete